jgi:FKBP-type peptidyl-prolyl cis-trans isomerase FklB
MYAPVAKWPRQIAMQMKLYLIPMLALALLVSAGCRQEKIETTTPKQRVSYSIGVDIGNNFKRQSIDIDPKVMAAGVADAIAGKTVLTEAERREVMTKFQQEMMAKMQAGQKVDGEKNLKTGEEFLVANAKKDGVKTTASGLQYKILKSGTGNTPKATDTVKTHYHGTLIDGTVFDSSVDRGEPATFPVNGVIPGWTEALQLMKEGDKWQLYIPAKLAYGENGAGGKIGPNSALIFDVELLSIEKSQ